MRRRAVAGDRGDPGTRSGHAAQTVGTRRAGRRHVRRAPRRRRGASRHPGALVVYLGAG